MATITAYLTKNEAGNVELWRTKPYYDKDLDECFLEFSVK